jgi:hypothetical protein
LEGLAEGFWKGFGRVEISESTTTTGIGRVGRVIPETRKLES